MQATNSRTLEIKGMKGEDCVQKVTGALKAVAGVTTQSVNVGSASITCEDQTRFDAACDSVRGVGFKARELGTGRPSVDAGVKTIPTPGTPAVAATVPQNAAPAIPVAIAPAQAV